MFFTCVSSVVNTTDGVIAVQYKNRPNLKIILENTCIITPKSILFYIFTICLAYEHNKSLFSWYVDAYRLKKGCLTLLSFLLLTTSPLDVKPKSILLKSKMIKMFYKIMLLSYYTYITYYIFLGFNKIQYKLRILENLKKKFGKFHFT